MKILVIAATSQEIAPFLKLNSINEVLICGVGIPSTVYHLTKKLLEEKYDLVINVGLAGAFDKDLLLGEAVIVIPTPVIKISIEWFKLETENCTPALADETSCTKKEIS